MESRYLTNINTDGHLRTDLRHCNVTSATATLTFPEPDAVLLQNFMPLIADFVKSRIANLLCDTLNKEIVPVISNRLMNTPMSAALFDQYFINYGLTERLQYLPTGVELKHRGNAFGIVRQGRNRLNDFRLPFGAPPLVPDNEPHGMVDFYLSNYTLASLIYWMDQYRKFDYEISKDNVNSSSLVGYLRTECANDDICAGTLFPALNQKYPNGLVQIKSHTAEYPRVFLDNQQAIITVNSTIEAFVQQNEHTQRFLNAQMVANVTLKKVNFVNYSLIADLQIEKFKILEVNSMIDGIDATSLEFLVGALNELLIGENIAKKLRDGIKLPILLDFVQKSSELVFEKDRMRISLNFCYSENCNVIAESNDMNLDYYDSVSASSN